MHATVTSDLWLSLGEMASLESGKAAQGAVCSLTAILW